MTRRPDAHFAASAAWLSDERENRYADERLFLRTNYRRPQNLRRCFRLKNRQKLGYLDSNQEQLNQNQPCCQLHHTPRR